MENGTQQGTGTEGTVMRIDQAELARRSAARRELYRDHCVATTWTRITKRDGGHVKEKFREHKTYEKKTKSAKTGRPVVIRAKKTRLCCMMKAGRLLSGRLPTKEMCKYLGLKFPYGREVVKEA